VLHTVRIQYGTVSSLCFSNCCSYIPVDRSRAVAVCHGMCVGSYRFINCVPVRIPAVGKTKALQHSWVRGTAAFVRADQSTTKFFISCTQGISNNVAYKIQI
jgi:hypothetical protein